MKTWLVCSLLVLTSTAQAADRAPRIDYMLNCQGCHLPDGSGMQGKVPDMRGILGKFTTVDGGRDYIVQVPGVANSKLGDAALTRLLNWLIAEMGPAVPDAGFEPYSETEVHRLRAIKTENLGALRASLIARIEAASRNP